MVISNLYFIKIFAIFIAHLNRIFKPADSNINFSFISCLCWPVIYRDFQYFELTILHLLRYCYHTYFCHFQIAFSSKTLISLDLTYYRFLFSIVFELVVLYY